MRQFLMTTQAQAVLWVGILLVLLTIAYYILKRIRDAASAEPVSTIELLSTFREMHDEGDLSDKELRTIKGVLGSKETTVARADKPLP